MAAKPLNARIWRSWILNATAMLLFAACVSFAQKSTESVEVGLDYASARTSVDYAPAHLNEKVLVRGVASGQALSFDGYRWLPIQNETGYGIFLEDPGSLLGGIQAGDSVEAIGVIGARAGVAVVKLQSISRRGGTHIPEPRRGSLSSIQSLRWSAVLVGIEGVVRDSGTGSSGAYIDLEDRGHLLRVFFPSNAGNANPGWNFFNGDRVRVTGYSSQYCPTPPYDRSFLLLIDNPSKAILLDSAWIISPYVVLGLLGLFVAGLAIWLWFERSWADQRRVIRSLNTLSEEILSCKSQAEVLRKLRESLPKSMKATGVRMYLYNKNTQSLDRLGSVAEPEVLSASVDAEANSQFAGAALAFRSRTLLTIPDSRRSPVYDAEVASKLAKSLVYVPMNSASEVAGVLELVYQKGYRKLSNDEQICAQHLGNQVAAAFRLMHQQAIQDQLLRSEKLAAAGQLISGIAGELKSPLASIESLAKNLLRQQMDSLTERDLRSITSQATQASDIVSRLIGFSRSSNSTATEIPLNALLKGLLQFRLQEFLLRSIKIEQAFTRSEIQITGNQGQLEQVFLNLLLYAEQQQSSAKERLIVVSTNTGGKKAIVTIRFAVAERTDRQDPLMPDVDKGQQANGLTFARGIFNAHGGEVGFNYNSAVEARFEVELPIAIGSSKKVKETKPLSKTWTTLVVEPDGSVQRKLLSILSVRGHRVVPVSSAEEAMDLLERLPFDLAFCSVRLPGKSWIDFYESVRHRLACFVLVTEGIDDGLSRVFEGAEGHLLRKPIDESEVEQLLLQIERGPAAAPVLEPIAAEPVATV